jgi:CDGSH-type Zn-finger protein
MFLNRNQIPCFQSIVIVLPKIKAYMSKTKLTINNNGSVKIEGDFEIVDRNGNEYGLQGRTVLSICRCGLSKNKPFCDGAHNGHFEHDAIAFDLPPKKV